MGFSKLKNTFFYVWYGKKLTPKAWPQNPKILLVSTTGLGDFIFSLPAITALKKAFPSSSLSYFTNPIGKELLQEEPRINEIFTLETPLFFSYFSWQKKLKKKGFDLIFIFHASQRLIFPLCASLKPKRLIGTEHQNKGLDFLFTDIVPWQSPHEIDRRLEQVKVVSSSVEKTIPSLRLTQKEKEQGKQLLHSLKLDPSMPILAIHAGAKDFYKCWPRENWVSLFHLIHEKSSYKILLLGGKNERGLNQSLKKEAPFILEAPLTLSIREFASLLSQVKALITNDTGPAHLAASLNLITIPIFSPTDPKKYAPLNPACVHILSQKRTCIPCLQRKCRHPFCLYQITPTRVFAKVASL